MSSFCLQYLSHVDSRVLCKGACHIYMHLKAMYFCKFVLCKQTIAESICSCLPVHITEIINWYCPLSKCGPRKQNPLTLQNKANWRKS